MGARGIAVVVTGLAVLAFAAPAGAAGWFAGDGHVHTCYSHDAWCPPDDDEGQDAFYSFGSNVSERFVEASAKGLNFLVISDHNNIRSHADPGFGTQGVTGIQAYEGSLKGGHAQIIGATKLYERGSGDSASTNALAQALRLDGGVFQANHPSGDFVGAPISSCDEASGDRMNWKYGYTVLPDTIELWNATALLQPAELFWECWLQRGARLGALAGSDSHGANHVNVGLPSMWVYAASNKQADILAALRAGRTTLSRVAPNQGPTRLLLEGDPDRNGSFKAMVGDEVPPGTPLRIRTDRGSGTGLLTVRANGKTAIDRKPLEPGGVVTLNAPAEPGWVRATLSLRNGVTSVDPSCSPVYPAPVTPCTEDLGMAAMTSPIYVGDPAPAPKVDPAAPAPQESAEQDRRPPVPAEQQGGTEPMPDVPPQRDRPLPVSKLRATWFHAAAARHRSLRVRLRWKASEGPFDVQIRRPGAKKWKSIASRTQSRQEIVRLARGTWKLRVRAVPPFAPAGPWRSLTIRL